MVESMVASWEYTKFDGDNEFRICTFITTEKQRITFLGTGLPQKKGVKYDFTGQFENGKFGRQFKVDSFELIAPKDEDSTINYLASGNFRGIGKKTAQRIFDMFGSDTLNVIENEPEKLLDIRGITITKIENITEDYKIAKDMSELYNFFSKHKLPMQVCGECYKKWGKDALFLLRQSPYDLYKRFHVSFTLTDKMALHEGVYPTHPERVEAAVLYALKEKIASLGHVFLLLDDFYASLLSVLNLNLDSKKVIVIADIIETIKQLRERKVISIIRGNGVHRVYLTKMMEQENDIVSILNQHIKMKQINVDENKMSCYLDEFENMMHIEFATMQRNAIVDALSSPVSIITGGAGTGKTTVLKALVSIYEALFPDNVIALVAPTGRAARNMTEKSGYPASTIHSYLGLTGEFHDNEDVQIGVDFLVIDEASMIDLKLFHILLKSIQLKSQVVIIGDHNQLESVGPGKVLKDLINSKVIPTTILDAIFRQEEDSSIIYNSIKINNGEHDFAYDDKFVFYDENDTGIIKAKLLEQHLAEVYRLGGSENVQIISPLREKGELSALAINKQVQKALNPSSKGITVNGVLLSIGDKVIQGKNGKVIMNGDIGYVKAMEYDGDNPILVIQFDEDIVKYDKTDLQKFKIALAYAITVHKSQGSEFEVLIMPITWEHRSMLRRNLFYTAVTRARCKVALIGDMTAAKYAIDNNKTMLRNTTLCQKLARACCQSAVPALGQLALGQLALDNQENQLSLFNAS